MKARTFSRLTSKSKFDFGLLAASPPRMQPKRSNRLYASALSDAPPIISSAQSTDIFVFHFDIVHSCIDRMDGVATNAVIAVPDDKYGEVSATLLLTAVDLRMETAKRWRHL